MQLIRYSSSINGEKDYTQLHTPYLICTHVNGALTQYVACMHARTTHYFTYIVSAMKHFQTKPIISELFTNRISHFHIILQKDMEENGSSGLEMFHGVCTSLILSSANPIEQK